MLTCIAIVAEWVQALTALCIVILTGWTLKVLRGYAGDTKRIANDSASQIERGQMPFLAIAMRDHGPGRVAGYVIENQGFGPALNIQMTCFTQNHERIQRGVPSLGAGRDHSVHNDVSTTFHVGEQIVIGYASLSGKTYRSTIQMVGGQMTTTFEKF